jgi:hypothetical protein
MIVGNRFGCRVQNWQAMRLLYNPSRTRVWLAVDESYLDRDAGLVLQTRDKSRR